MLLIFMKENLRLRTIMSGEGHSMLEACIKCAEENVKDDGERKKCAEEKEVIMQTDSPMSRIITDAM